jgi:hypothetical protein
MHAINDDMGAIINHLHSSGYHTIAVIDCTDDSMLFGFPVWNLRLELDGGKIDINIRKEFTCARVCIIILIHNTKIASAERISVSPKSNGDSLVSKINLSIVERIEQLRKEVKGNGKES